MSSPFRNRDQVYTRFLFWEILRYRVELPKNRPKYWGIRLLSNLGFLPYMAFCTFSVTITAVITGGWQGWKHGCAARPGCLWD